MSFKKNQNKRKTILERINILDSKGKGFLIIVSLITVLLVVLLISFRKEILIQTRLITNTYPAVSEKQMNKLKTQGCVFDGLLTPRYNQHFENSVAMLGRSKCQYIHRAIETWNIPPDFSEIKRRMNIIKKQTGKDFTYGLFIAESIDVTKNLPGKKKFNFRAMCAPGTLGAWGKNTCKPSLGQSEYRRYLNYITKRAIDLGITDFTFGQIYYQDPTWKKSSNLVREIISEMKNYAIAQGKEISVGAQTNTMDREEYLKRFDYITGGVGQHKNGWIEDQDPCWSYYYKRSGYCWAMLWHEKYKSKANNILVYLDWNNNSTDDIHRFINMSKEKRRIFLGKAYDFFRWRNIGFLLPLGEVLGNVGGGCHGATREFYSANNSYTCQDENSINDILSHKWPLPNYAQFISQKVPREMEAGKKYLIKLKMRNTSFRIWSKENKYKLGAINPRDNIIWGANRVEFANEDEISHGQEKEFNFEVTAPKNPGEYNFQWRMLLERIEWFGQKSENVVVEVIPAKQEIVEKVSLEDQTIVNKMNQKEVEENKETVTIKKKTNDKINQKELKTVIKNELEEGDEGIVNNLIEEEKPKSFWKKIFFFLPQ